ncbi:hypothetical protein ACFO3O_22350 [Dokdonia ponticola]|uniref:Secreted protein n=1 Tax=Dokdonia ponticola TaxID=2041041 RepID=A0ABV9I483_9FLAO
MKKLLLIFTICLFTISIVSCEPDKSIEEEQNEFATGHGEVGDPAEETEEEGGN